MDITLTLSTDRYGRASVDAIDFGGGRLILYPEVPISLDLDELLKLARMNISGVFLANKDGGPL